LQQQHDNRNKENVSTPSLENRHSTLNNKLIAYVNTEGSIEFSLARKIGKIRENDSPDSRKADRGCSTRPTQWQRTGNQIDAAMIFAALEFVKARWLHGMVEPLACYTQ
jgi:hypothetical protein